MKFLQALWTALGVLFMLLTYCDGANILFVTIFPAKGHWLTFEHIIVELLNRGHEITAITNYKLNTQLDHNRYREVLIDPIYECTESDMELYFKSDGYQYPTLNIVMTRWHGLLTTEHAIQSDSVRKFLGEKGLKYDLVIAEQFVQEAFLMFGHKYNAPIVTINTIGYTDYIDRAFGMMTPLSFVPHYFAAMSDKMTYLDRLYNVYLAAYDWSHRKYDYIGEQEAMAREFFADNEQDRAKLPSLHELELNVSLVLTNNHIVFSEPRPKMAGMIDIAGAHIRGPKKLPPNIERFLKSSSKGVIYINFGTILLTAALPDPVVAAFLEIFSNMTQYNFIWKWEGVIISQPPPNVYMDNWLPQNDLLAHPMVKLFVTHGGIFGAQEAIYWAKPMLFVPFYGDQHRNAFKLEKAGVGVTLAKDNITGALLRETILQILNNDSFRQNVNHLSSLFRDNPTDPLEEALFWIEYVIRHHGAAHLKSAAIQVPWYKYLLLDVYMLALIVMYASYRVMRWSVRQIILAYEYKKLMVKKNQ